MLGKLIKHEFKATGRMFLPLYAVALVLTPLLGALSLLMDNKNPALAVVSGFSTVGYVLILTALGIASFVLIFIRFYQSTAKDEGYLLFTLPAKVKDILFSKLLVSAVWEIASVIVIGFSVLLFTYMHNLWSFTSMGKLFDFFSEFLTLKGYGNVQLLVALYIIAMLVSTISGTLQVFASIGLGQTMKNHRVAFSIMYYVLTYMVMQLVSTFALIPFLFTSGAFDDKNQSASEVVNSQLGLMGISIGLQVLFGVAFFLVANYCYKKKLNLE
jgi:hypothetical protein